MSNASTSGVSRAKAFFFPSGLSHQSALANNYHLQINFNLPNQRVDLHTLHIIQLLQRILDLPLIRPHIDNEDKRIVLLNLLHRALRVQRMDDDLVLVQPWLMRNRFARIFR